MPNMEFGQMRSLIKYVEEQSGRTDAHRGGVLRHDFDLHGTIELLEEAKLQKGDIMTYVIASNPVLWAQYWLRNPQDPRYPLELFWYQKNILNCQSSYKLTRCGRQVGKTLCMAVDILYNAMNNEHMRQLFVAPYQSQVKVLFEDTVTPLIHDVPEVKNSIVKMPSHPYYQAEFKNGSVVKAMTAGTRSGQKGAGIRGIPGIDRLYMDEIDYMGEAAISAVSAVKLAKPQSKVWVSSTPSGKREQFYHWAMDTDSQYRCHTCNHETHEGSPFHYPSHVSPLFSEESDLAYKKSNPAHAYAQEILAEWGEELEGVFRHTDLDFAIRASQGPDTVDPNTGDIVAGQSYKYEDLRPQTGCIYIMGVDWNKETTGVQLCILEYNTTDALLGGLPAKTYRIFRTEIINAKEFTEKGAVSRIMQLDRELPLSYIYADEGYGTTQIEAIKKMAMNGGRVGLANKLVAINMSSTQIIHDPVTRKEIKKPMKAFMVDNAARVVESRRFLLPDHEDERIKLGGQMREYVVIRRGPSGSPVYSDDNEDMLTAFMLALLGYTREYSDLVKMESVNTVLVSKTNPVSARATANVPARWEDAKDKDPLEAMGIPHREGAFEELAHKVGLDYEYTRDRREAEYRPSKINRVNSLRGGGRASRSGGGRLRYPGRPSGRTF